eukprot:scaffold644_cov357-Pavlova_lutheri.AAC.22
MDSSCRLGQSDAVDATATQQDLSCRHRDHFFLKHTAKDGGSGRVAFHVSKRRDHQSAVGIVKIHVGTGQEIPSRARHCIFHHQATGFLLREVHGLGDRQLDNFERATLCISAVLQDLKCRFGSAVLGVVGVVCPCQQDRPWTDKAGHVVYMSVGVHVPVESAGEPNHLGGAQALAQPPFNLFFRPRGVAIGIQQALFGGEQGAFSICVYASILQHHVLWVSFHAFQLQYLPSYEQISVPGCVAPFFRPSPRIEAPVHASDFLRVVVNNERGTRVSGPGVVEGHLHHPHLFRERLSRLHPLVAAREHRHGFEPGDGTRDFREGSLRRLGVAPPVVLAFLHLSSVSLPLSLRISFLFFSAVRFLETSPATSSSTFRASPTRLARGIRLSKRGHPPCRRPRHHVPFLLSGLSPFRSTFDPR